MFCVLTIHVTLGIIQWNIYRLETTDVSGGEHTFLLCLRTVLHYNSVVDKCRTSLGMNNQTLCRMDGEHVCWVSLRYLSTYQFRHSEQKHMYVPVYVDDKVYGYYFCDDTHVRLKELKMDNLRCSIAPKVRANFYILDDLAFNWAIEWSTSTLSTYS